LEVVRRVYKFVEAVLASVKKTSSAVAGASLFDVTACRTDVSWIRSNNFVLTFQHRKGAMQPCF